MACADTADHLDLRQRNRSPEQRASFTTHALARLGRIDIRSLFAYTGRP
jgi:hypothetical protein